MKIKNFPENYKYNNFLTYDGKLLFLVFNYPLPNSHHEWRRRYHGMLYDPITDAKFGHLCHYQAKPKQKLPGIIDGEVEFHESGYDPIFMIGTNSTHPVFLDCEQLSFYEKDSEGDIIHKRVMFDVLTGSFFKDTIGNLKAYFINRHVQTMVYEKELIAYCNGFYESQISIDHVHDIEVLKYIKQDVTLDDSYVGIYQPSIDNSLKTLDVGFPVENLFKHPTEPMLIACGEEKYAVIDLDI